MYDLQIHNMISIIWLVGFGRLEVLGVQILNILLTRLVTLFGKDFDRMDHWSMNGFSLVTINRQQELQS